MGQLTRWRLRWGMLVLLWSALFVAGCSAGDVLRLPRWQLHTADMDAPVELEFPRRFEEHLDPENNTYVLSATAELPPAWRGRPLTVAIPYFAALTSLEVDGVRVPRADVELFSTYRSRGVHRWRLTEVSTRKERLELRITVEHRWQRSAWLDSVPRITPRLDGGWHCVLVTIFNEVLAIVCVGALLAIGFVSGTMFLSDRRRHYSYGWLAFATLTVAYYPMFILGVTQFWGPGIDLWFAGVAVATAGTIGIVRMGHSALETSGHERLFLGLCLLNVVVDLWLIHNPFVMPLAGGRAAIGAVLVALLYLVRFYWKHRNLRAAREQLVAVTGFTLSMIPAACVWTGIGDPLMGVRTSVVGLIFYASVQFMSMVRSHLEALTLAQRHGEEIDVLNAELRQQVLDKSQKLSQALARLGVHAEESRPEIGSIIDERYRVKEELGRGAMGTAYAVERLSDGRLFAIKVLTNSSDARIMARFAREAHIAATVAHPNLTRIFDVNFAASGFMYLVMEFVDGEALDRKKSRYGDVDWVLPILRDVARGLAELHRANVLHRDLKPANILLSEDPEAGSIVAKISDFGISGLVPEGLATPDAPMDDLGDDLEPAICDDAATMVISRDEHEQDRTSERALTRVGELMGTPAYMAPELYGRGVPATFQTDVFSFGVLAFQLLTGEFPYETPPVVARSRGEKLPPVASLASRKSDLDPAVAELVQSCLAYDPSVRPSAPAILRTLEGGSARGVDVQASP